MIREEINVLDGYKLVNEGNPVYLTKNGYGAMVVLSIEAYSNLIDGVEEALDLADAAAAEKSYPSGKRKTTL